MSASDEARRVQSEDLERRAYALSRTRGSAAAAVIHVREDGTLTVACGCGEDLAHPSGRSAYTLRRVSSHMDLHASAAAQGVPWDVVQAERQRRVLR